MAGKVLNLRDMLKTDDMGCFIAKQWQTWQTLRRNWITEKEELRKYIFATDTKHTQNNKLPWRNRTTVPKLCQIRDNLSANYMASMFPKKDFFTWLPYSPDGNVKKKRDSILNHTRYWTSQDRYKAEMAKCVLDYIDYGNCFGTVEWVDERQVLEDNSTKVGFVGPAIRRISPLDINFNPTSPTFLEAPKIVRTIMSFGEVKALIESMTTSDNQLEMEDLFDYLKQVRVTTQTTAADWKSEDTFFEVDGFTSFRAYLMSDYVEILTFYGDIYDWQTDTFYKNHQVMVVDRHKILGKPRPNPSYFGFPPIFHVGWRVRQDNLWAMGPLDNLVGMQYQIDKLENAKADGLDLILVPPLTVKGYVQDFEWGPMERIYIGDDGEVKPMQISYEVLRANEEINVIMARMEEMAGAPKEAMGFRSPGEKTKYEVQSMENGASRIFNAKSNQFEEQFTERLLNAGLELARRHIDSAQTISIFDEEFKITDFMELTVQDITGAGKLKPIAARHFAQQSELVQNLTNFANSKLGMDPAVQVHFSSLGLAKMFEEIFNLEDYKIVQPYIRLSEQADATRLQSAHQEQVGMEQQQPAGLHPDDVDPDLGGNVPPDLMQPQ